MSFCFSKKGIITTLVLVFGAIFLILLGGLLGFILLQLRQASQKVAWNESLHIAEAGVNYYRWCLNNDVEQTCQTEKDYFDPAGNPIGHFSLQISSTVSCGETVQKKIISEGWTNKFPQVKRKISVLYARTSVAKYSYILNDNGELIIDYQANTDELTIINLTNHAYFNLSGAGNGSIGNHLFFINADFYTPINQHLIPTGELRPVYGSPFNFRI